MHYIVVHFGIRRKMSFGKHFFRQAGRLGQALLGENHRRPSKGRIGDVSLLVQTVHRVLVDRLPRPAFLVQSEPKTGEHSFIHFVQVEFHGLDLVPGCVDQPGFARPDSRGRLSPHYCCLYVFRLRLIASRASLSAVRRLSVSRLSQSCLPFASASSTFTLPFLKYIRVGISVRPRCWVLPTSLRISSLCISSLRVRSGA